MALPKNRPVAVSQRRTAEQTDEHAALGRPPHAEPAVAGERVETNLLFSTVWFVGLGWWLSGLAVAAAILLQLSIFGVPAAVWLINRLPQITTLKPSPGLRVNEHQAGATWLTFIDEPQRPFVHRALYFMLVGWWAVTIWMAVAWLASLTIFLLPLSFWMFRHTGGIQTLRR